MSNPKNDMDTPPAEKRTAIRGQILVVEDDVMVAAILQGRLKKMGYDVPTTVASGEKALEKVRENPPAIVLMDIVLSGKMDGIETAQCIRHEFDIPVIYLTSHTDPETLTRAGVTEPFGYIVKPFEEGELRAGIEIAAYRHQADRERRRSETAVKRLNESLEERVKQRTAQLEAVNHELEAFTYSVSHDLRAPIRVIDGFANALADNYGASLDDEGKRFLRILCQNTKRMDKMVQDFLRLSQLGHNPLQWEKTDMTALAREVAANLVSHPKQKTPRIEIAALPQACCDRALIQQVWENLFSNAIKYTGGKAAPQINVNGQVQDQEVIYSVGDNGVGFNMRQAGKLFGVFQRLHSDKAFEGSGVGLSIVQRIVLRHGGRVWAEAAVDKGATFYFSLPSQSK